MKFSKEQFSLFLISFLSLFFEMVFIRWTPAEVKVLAYFTNFILIASLFGLGLGCLLAKYRWQTISFLPPYFLATIVLVFFFRKVIVALPSGDTLLLLGEGDVPMMNLYLALVIFYLVISLLFIPFGQITGKLLNSLPPLQAYSINILGSLTGVMIFFVLSKLNLSSLTWFVIGLIGLSYFFRESGRQFIVYSLCLISTLCLIFLMSQDSVWSPYNKITTSPMKLESDPPHLLLEFSKPTNPEKITELPKEVGLNVRISNIFYQYILDLSPSSVTNRPYLKPFRNQYDYPYKLASLEDVLIIGGGTGNDAAGALRQGARRVDVVEIDPMLVEIGKSLHPERPYQNPKVSVYIDDARSFMKKIEKKYDLVVFGLLDSHQIFSSMSNVRLDSFVYTVESFQNVRKILKDSGIVLVSFALGDAVSVNRMNGIMKKSFPDVRLSFANDYHPLGVQFLAGNSNHLPGLQGDNYVFLREDLNDPVPLSTDDWPFFYMKSKVIPSEYLLFIFIILVVSFLMVYPIIKEKKGNFHFFFLGSAFMLLETKSITSLGLIYGSTWIVSSIVIAAILLVILLANLLVSICKPQNQSFYYVILLASLIFSYFVPLEIFLRFSSGLKFLLSSLFFSFPIFIAGIIFAISFRKVEHRDQGLAFNLMGVVAGGLSEYASLASGFRYLIILALLMYFVSYLFTLKRN